MFVAEINEKTACELKLTDQISNTTIVNRPVSKIMDNILYLSESQKQGVKFSIDQSIGVVKVSLKSTSDSASGVSMTDCKFHGPVKIPLA